MKKHCCERMAEQVAFRCPDHADQFECPDALVAYSERSGEFGLIIHDGGSSLITINFCPWCGAKLA
jgi:hypothetical protein